MISSQSPIRRVLLTLICIWPRRGAASSGAGDLAFGRGYQAYAIEGNLVAAKSAFLECLEHSPERLDAKTNLASVLVDLEEKADAEQMYRDVLAVESSYAADAAFNLGLLLQERDDPECCDLFASVVSADPSRWDAWANLAVSAQQHRPGSLVPVRAYQRAIGLLEAAREVEESSADLEQLGIFYYEFGMRLSELTQDQCATIAPELTGKESALPTALTSALDATVDSPPEACLAVAEASLRQCQAMLPGHEIVQYAEHMLAAIVIMRQELRPTGGGDEDGPGWGAGAPPPAPSAASSAYVRALFDDYSDSFDASLASLGYQVPELLSRTAEAFVNEYRAGRPFRTAIDAGCGTGLMGVQLRRCGCVDGTLVGCDLSPKMLEKAQARCTPTGERVYDRLQTADLLEPCRADLVGRYGVADRGNGGADADAACTGPLTSSTDDAGFELVTSADVLIYFGDLETVLGTLSSLGAPSSVLMFSCESASTEEAPGGWIMRKSGRFAHTREYVEATAESAGGFDLVSHEDIVVRTDGTVPVGGHLFVFARGL